MTVIVIIIIFHNMCYILKILNITVHLRCDGHSIKYLWSVGGKGQSSSLKEGASHTYTLRLG